MGSTVGEVRSVVGISVGCGTTGVGAMVSVGSVYGRQDSIVLVMQVLALLPLTVRIYSDIIMNWFSYASDV